MEKSTEIKPYVGGQAVLEGVMMRSPRSLAVAVRRPDGTIVVREDAWVSLWERVRFLRWPFVRGAMVLIESLFNGIQALNFSALHAATSSEGEEKKSEAKLKNLENEVSPGMDPAPTQEPGPARVAGTITVSFM